MEIPAPSTDLDRLLHDLSTAGVAVLAEALPGDRVVDARARLDAIAEAERHAGTAILEDGAGSDGRYRSGANQRVLSLLAKDEVFRNLAADDAVVGVARRSFGGTYGYPDDVLGAHGLDRVLLSNHTLELGDDLVASAPEDLLELIGYQPWLTFGHVEHHHLQALTRAASTAEGA